MTTDPYPNLIDASLDSVVDWIRQVTKLRASDVGNADQVNNTIATNAALVPVKATGAEIDTATDDAKFATAKALKDSHNVPSVAPGTSGNLLTSNGTDWVSSARGSTRSTRQYLTSGSGATYTTPAGCVAILVKMVGGGGGGGAQVTNNGTAGNDSIFNGVHAAGGGAGTASEPHLGGVGGTGGTGSASYRSAGQAGECSASISGHGTGIGGASRFGFPALGTITTQAAPGDAPANSGAGGNGGNQSNTCGSGGGGGEYVEIYISSPAGTYTYTVAASAAGGVAGVQAGGAGGSGMIIVEEFY